MSAPEPTPVEDPEAPAVAADLSEPKESPRADDEKDETTPDPSEDDEKSEGGDDSGDDDDSDDGDSDDDDSDDDDSDDDDSEDGDSDDDDSDDDDSDDGDSDDDDSDDGEESGDEDGSDEDKDEQETSSAEAGPVEAEPVPAATEAEPVLAATEAEPAVAEQVELVDAEPVPAPVMGAAAPPPAVTEVVAADHAQHLRLLEALVFAGTQALDEKSLAERLPNDADLPRLLADLAEIYANRGVNLVKVAGGYAFRTAPDLSEKLKIERPVTRKLSRASIETLAIIAYHQPATRAEIEQVRGVGLSKGTLDLLFEQNWIKPMGRRRAPGKPVTWGTTDFFLEHFGLPSLDDLPGQEELKAAGLLDARSQPPIFRPEEPDLPLVPTEDEDAEPLAAEEQGR
jgi:segregation and condensation protein B